MKRLLIVLLAMAALAPAYAAAVPGATQVTGGGRGTIDNGASAFSQFGFGASIAPDGSAQGHFNCLMAGSSLFPDPQFQPLMKVDGQVSTGSVNAGAGTAVLRGSGTLNLGPNGRFPAQFSVAVKEGGPGVGTLTLTVLSPRLGAAPVTLPVETVLHGAITIH
jgi:hypothetical protein